jgi:hypothetical protein
VSPPECIEVQETTTVPECKTNCDARARFEASCTEPSLEVTYGYEATAAQRMALDRLVVALSNNYARLLVSGYRAAVVIHDAAVGYATALDGVSATAKQVGLGAAACVTEAVVRVGSAISKIDVSISVSVSVTASVSAMGGLPPPM